MTKALEAIGIRTRNKRVEKVKAYKTKSPYLFVHESVGVVDFETLKPVRVEENHGWTITHQPTGRAVTSEGLLKKEDAIKAANQMSLVVDFSSSTQKSYQKGQREKVQRILSQFPSVKDKNPFLIKD